MTPRTIPDILPGTLDLLILHILRTEPLHGWALSERIQQISQDVLQINQGSLYPALHRLEHRGWIEAGGAPRSWAEGRSITGSPRPDAGGWGSRPASGNACPRPSGA